MFFKIYVKSFFALLFFGCCLFKCINFSFFDLLFLILLDAFVMGEIVEFLAGFGVILPIKGNFYSDFLNSRRNKTQLRNYHPQSCWMLIHNRCFYLLVLKQERRSYILLIIFYKIWRNTTS